MSRFFNGGVAADRITCSSGLMTSTQGPITIAALARITATGVTAWMVQGAGGGFAKFSTLISSGPLFFENDFGSGGPTIPTNQWCWLVGTKGSGSVPPRWHVLNITAGTAWSHSNGPANVNDIGGTTDTIIIGGQLGGGASTTWRGQIAACAVWNSVLSDLAVEAACTLSALDLKNASPKWGVLLNQSSVATPVTDFTGGGGDQTSISGTAVDASEPPGWSYNLTATVIPNGLAIPVALGQPTASLAGASSNGLAIPVATGQPAAALGLVARPNGLAIPVATGQPSALPPTITSSPNAPIVATTRHLANTATSSNLAVVSR